jgi:hypothetical protein
MNFTLNNHLRYTIGDRQFGIREYPYEKFKVSIGKIDTDYYKTSNWLQEQYRVAELISKEYGNDFVVMFSGGTDSEIVLRAFKHIGIIPRVVFIKFSNDYNVDDFIIAKRITDDLGLTLESIDFDVKEFYHSGQAYEFATDIQCRQMAYLTVYHHIRKMQLPAVMGGEMMLRRHTSPAAGKWYYCFRENEDASAMRFSLKFNVPLVNEWFSYTPEMMGYYLAHPKIQWLITDRFNYKTSSVSTKNEVLAELMPSILDKVKTHGYEKLMGFNGETYNTLYLSHTKRLESSLDGIFIDEVYTQLFGEKYAGCKINQ